MAKDHIHKKGEIVNGLEIIEQLRVPNGKYTQKGYLVKCTVDGYVSEISETYLTKGIGCAVCCGRVALKGYNDIATTHPQLINLFQNKEDAYSHKIYTTKKLIFVCPLCGEVKNTLPKTIMDNFTCRRCGDNISYGEKFIFNALSQAQLDFITQLSKRSFDWCGTKFYDFYIPSLNCIIEVHGEQHYKTAFTKVNEKARTVKEEQENDKEKEQLARKNGITTYIQLDCQKSTKDYIINSLRNSELSKIIDFTSIDFDKCHAFSINSRVKEVSSLWEKGINSTEELAKLTKLNRTTVIKYLKQGSQIGWCSYDPREEMRKSMALASEKRKFYKRGHTYE